MSERFLKWAVKRHYESLGYGVKISRIRLGNTEIDGEAARSDGGKIAIEVKTLSDYLARGLGQLAEALASVTVKLFLSQLSGKLNALRA